MTIVHVEGHYRDRLVAPDGCVLHDSGWLHNLIVLRCRILLAGFLRNDTAKGIQALRVGHGDDAWDAAPPPAADPTTTDKLVDPAPYVVPVADLKLEYLDANEAISGTATNRVQVTAVLGPGKPNPIGSQPYKLREFGLFGAFGGAPFMIDYIRHPLIEKDASMTLERKVRLLL